MSLWLSACTTTRHTSPLPKVTPPDPYDEDGRLVWVALPAGTTYTAETNGFFIPEWYFRRLFDYIEDSQAALAINEEKSDYKAEAKK